MKSFSYFKTWLFIGAILVITVIFLTLTSVPVPMPQIEFGDKISHLIAYAALTGWFSQLFSRLTAQIKLFIAFCLMGISLEFLQGLGGVRMFEYADMVANALGAAMGWWLSRTWFAGTLLKVDQYLSSNCNS